MAEVRAEFEQVRAQVDAFANFKSLLDGAKYYGLFASQNLSEAQKLCQELLQHYDDITRRPVVRPMVYLR